MDGDWTTSPSAARVLQHAADPRPAWLWSADGQVLLWHNPSAALFLARLKKHGLKLAEPAIPIKGQVARNIRLGSPGRSSLARIQFQAGDKPASATCAATPLVLAEGQAALLIVGVDPIAADILEAFAEQDSGEPVATHEAEALVSGDGESEADFGPQSENETETRAEADTQIEPETHHEPEADIEPVAAISDAHSQPVLVEDAGTAPDAGAEETHSTDEVVAIEPPAIDSDESAYERELQNWREIEDDDAATDVPPEAISENSVSSRLSRLVDQLSADSRLFTPLNSQDAPTASNDEAVQRDAGEALPCEANRDAMESLRNELDSAADLPADQPDEPTIEAEADADEPIIAEPPKDPDSVERVSRYNFDELSRILNDRVGDSAPPPTPAVPAQRTGSLINLGGETLVLNRLPLGILVFRDQQVLFANRAITEMVGYSSVENLRAAGLAAVFPAAGPQGQEAGPVNHLVQRDRTLVPVTARLQSISWQGRPALMLSASTTEVRTGHEAAVRAFAQSSAELRGDGYFEATRSGVISAMSPRGAALLETPGMIEGKALSAFVGGTALTELREFLERPARFAETERPYIQLRLASGKADLMLFAQGQAGVVAGYFGYVRGRDIAPLRLPAPDTDSALLARISRGVRRPLNTIIGFADLLRMQAFGGQEDRPFEGYARDIATAGQDIAALVDELDSFAQLRDGRYLPQRSSIALTALLESCVLRIRGQANQARVIVRNGIAENLPKVTADRASLEQAVLNLLASAIDQSPTGGAVVISAQVEDDGGIAVHVRDSSSTAVDMAERFVVFRDGVGRDGRNLAPVRSSVGLALTRSLLAVNAFSLSVDPAGQRGLLFTLVIPADLVEERATPEVAE